MDDDLYDAQSGDSVPHHIGIFHFGERPLSFVFPNSAFVMSHVYTMVRGKQLYGHLIDPGASR